MKRLVAALSSDPAPQVHPRLCLSTRAWVSVRVKRSVSSCAYAHAYQCLLVCAVCTPRNVRMHAPAVVCISVHDDKRVPTRK